MLEGVRVAAVLLIGITTVTAFIGAGGLGALIVQGIGQNAPDLILLGALPMIVLAVVADFALRARRARRDASGGARVIELRNVTKRYDDSAAVDASHAHASPTARRACSSARAAAARRRRCG